MKNQELKVGDIIVITDENTKNYLQLGIVKEIRPYKEYTETEMADEIKDYLRRFPDDTREDAIKEIKRINKWKNQNPYVVEFNCIHFQNTGIYSNYSNCCDSRIEPYYYDTTLPKKCKVLYCREK